MHLRKTREACVWSSWWHWILVCYIARRTYDLGSTYYLASIKIKLEYKPSVHSLRSEEDKFKIAYGVYSNQGTHIYHRNTDSRSDMPNSRDDPNWYFSKRQTSSLLLRVWHGRIFWSQEFAGMELSLNDRRGRTTRKEAVGPMESNGILRNGLHNAAGM